jgi:transposase IS116/IS110/IS902 family protein
LLIVDLRSPAHPGFGDLADWRVYSPHPRSTPRVLTGRQQRVGHISKQGNPFLRGLLVEAAQSAVRHEPEMRRAYQRLAQRKCLALAKVATARKLAVRLYWMLRLQVNYTQLIQGSHAGQPGTFCGRVKCILAAADYEFGGTIGATDSIVVW